MRRASAICSSLCMLLLPGLLAPIARVAMAQQQPPRPKPLRARPRISRGQAVEVLGSVRPLISKEHMDAMDLDHASGLYPSWYCSVAIVPVKSDLLKFPDEKAPVFVVGIREPIEGWGGPFAGLQAGTYVVVAQGNADEAEIYNFHRRAEPVARTTMKVRDRERPSEKPKWFLQQRGMETWYHLLLGDKAYSFPILLPPEKKEAAKGEPGKQ